MYKKNIMVVVVAAILCLALATAGCSSGKSGNEAEGGILKIGNVGPLTGEMAAYGTNVLRGIEVAVEEANATKALGEITLKLISEDTVGDTTAAANAFSKLIDIDKVDVIIGAVLSGETATGGPLVMEAGIPTISPSSTAVDLTKGNPYLFRNCLSDEVQAVLAEYAVQEMGLGKFAIFYTNNDYGKSLKEAFETKAKKLAEVVAVEVFMDKDENFKSQLTSIKEKNPDCLYIAGYYTEAAKIAQQARELGMDIQLLGADGLCNAVLLEIGQEAVEGVYATSGFYPDDPTPAVQNFVTAYRKKYGEDPDMFAAQAYDAALIVFDAIKTKGATSEKIREGLAATKDFPGITGKTSIDDEGDTIKDVLILKVEGGKFVRVR